MSGGNHWDPVRDYVDKYRPKGVSQVYDGVYQAGKSTGEWVQKGIKQVDRVSPAVGTAARVGVKYAEENGKLSIFQDNRPNKN
ncbi:unnamed protein product [Oppiella nova]|uniref:Uncharacterized protein n=1 Tax=Oppiella nova TaxID=334625 RepID=A0A7R9MKC6_9ACAR|nr:unnamed protein product [Oppiella nova]CAG2178850.1 unnamed protein product [Oppiella nova]